MRPHPNDELLHLLGSLVPEELIIDDSSDQHQDGCLIVEDKDVLRWLLGKSLRPRRPVSSQRSCLRVQSGARSLSVFGVLLRQAWRGEPSHYDLAKDSAQRWSCGPRWRFAARRARRRTKRRAGRRGRQHRHVRALAHWDLSTIFQYESFLITFPSRNSQWSHPRT